MSFFGVTIETLEAVSVHPTADRLELAKCHGLSFQLVVEKGKYKEGNKVLFFPLDSLLPDELIVRLGMVGKFSGEQKNIVRTCTLRGQISQGFCCMASDLIPEHMMSASPEALTEYLGVTKYEIEPVDLRASILVGLPSGYSAYDISGADRNQDVVDLLMDQNVVIMEKMEGENSSYGNVMGENFVNCRERSIIEKPGYENDFWKIARSEKLHDLVGKYKSDTAMAYGEACGPGIHGNHYQLKENRVFLFDLRAGFWVDFNSFEQFLKDNGKMALIAPIIFKGKLRDFLAGRTVQEASNGISLFNPKVKREGFVIKPFIEQQHPRLGRLIIKQRSPEYLKETGR